MVEVSFSPKKFSKLEIKASDYLMNSMENSVFQFSVSDFHPVTAGLTKHVLLVQKGYMTLNLLIFKHIYMQVLLLKRKTTFP